LTFYNNSDSITVLKVREKKQKIMRETEIRNKIKEIVNENIRYADPKDSINTSKFHGWEAKEFAGKEGYCIQSAEEVLDDIIHDLKSLQREITTSLSPTTI